MREKRQIIGGFRFRGGWLSYWNIYGNDGVAGRLEISLPEEQAGEGAGGEDPGPGAPQKLFYLKDHLGSTRAVMNTNGAVVESYDYAEGTPTELPLWPENAGVDLPGNADGHEDSVYRQNHSFQQL